MRDIRGGGTVRGRGGGGGKQSQEYVWSPVRTMGIDGAGYCDTGASVNIK